MITTATSQHLQDINNIYNKAVKDGLRTAHTEPVSLEERKNWYQKHDSAQYPIFVYLENNKLKGWLSISPYREGRQALNEVVVISYYVDYEHHGQGIASALMEHALNFCKAKNFRLALAILIDGNEPSIKLLEKFHFEECGRIPNGIHYDDIYRNHLYYCKSVE